VREIGFIYVGGVPIVTAAAERLKPPWLPASLTGQAFRKLSISASLACTDRITISEFIAWAHALRFREWLA
jgi:hypothetical protein